MFPSRSSDRADLSTEIGFAVVGGIALAYTAPGRVVRHVTGKVTGALGSAQNVAESCTDHIARVAGRR